MSLSVEAIRQITAPSPHGNILSALPRLTNASTTRRHQKSLYNEDSGLILRPVRKYQPCLCSSNPRQDSRQESATSDGHRRSDPSRSIYPDSPYTNEFQYINYNDSKDEDKPTRTTIPNAFKD
jgi:hypothetical protein